MCLFYLLLLTGKMVLRGKNRFGLLSSAVGPSFSCVSVEIFAI